VWEFVEQFPKVTETGPQKLPGFGTLHNYTKRSIFWDLPYWKDNLVRHNLDVMHIEKNFFDNVFNTLMNVPNKTKDNEKSRRDLEKHCYQRELELVRQSNGKMGIPKARYTLTTQEAKLVCQWVKELRMPDGYASNLAWCADVNKGVISGMKSHDCHVFMQNLIPIAFRSLSELVWKPLIEISQFFKDIFCSSIKVTDLDKMEQDSC
jgi:hypothetical protein